MTKQRRFRRRDEIKIKPVGQSVAAFVGDQNALHVLNPTAQLILEYLREPATRDELILMLTEATDGAETNIRADLDDVLDSFLEYQLIELTP